MRFDFSHPKPLSPDDIHAIEAEVNDRIRANAEVATRLLTPDRAVAEGALALFGEKYGDEVRVVAMGGVLDGENKPFSVELCGGTHVGRTGDIGLFKIVSETAIASGVRRIEALTGAAAEAHLAEEEDLLRQAAAALRTSPAELPARIVSLVDERRRLERELAEARRALASAGPAVKTGAKRIGEVAFDGRVVDDVPGRELKSLADDLKRRIGSGIVAVVSRADGKAAIVVGVTDDLTERFDAVELVRSGAAALGGKGGGGRPDMAQAGGPEATQAAAAVAAVENAVAAKLRGPISAPAAE
jgi:alanyl-tRNA synthetase